MNSLYKLTILLCISMMMFSSCLKNQYDKDIDKIDDYISSHHLDTLNIDKDDRGLYHIILQNGSGIYPSKADSVTITFTLKLINDKVVNDNNAITPCTVPMSDLVYGLQLGICKMRTGETAVLLLPSYLGYGTYTVDKIPSNSVLIYYIKLISTKSNN